MKIEIKDPGTVEDYMKKLAKEGYVSVSPIRAGERINFSPNEIKIELAPKFTIF